MTRRRPRHTDPQRCEYLITPYWTLESGQRVRCSNLTVTQIDGRWLCRCHRKKAAAEDTAVNEAVTAA